MVEDTLINDVIQDIDFTKKILAQKRMEICKIESDIRYYEGMHDGANNILALIKKYLESKKQS